jgi:hypothetical protein
MIEANSGRCAAFLTAGAKKRPPQEWAWLAVTWQASTPLKGSRTPYRMPAIAGAEPVLQAHGRSVAVGEDPSP